MNEIYELGDGESKWFLFFILFYFIFIFYFKKGPISMELYLLEESHVNQDNILYEPCGGHQRRHYPRKKMHLLPLIKYFNHL